MAGLRRRRPAARHESTTHAPVAEIVSAHEAGLSTEAICGIYGLDHDEVEQLVSSTNEQWFIDPRD